MSCGNFQRTNPRKGNPSNQGDTAAGILCKQSMAFENIFDPFSQTYKKANKKNQNKPLPEHIPYSKLGSNRINLKNTDCSKKRNNCQQNNNNNSVSVICKQNETFDLIMEKIK